MYWGMTWRACLLDIEKPYQKGARELSTEEVLEIRLRVPTDKEFTTGTQDTRQN